MPNPPTSAADRKDPLPVFCFKVELPKMSGEMFFKSAGGLKYETEVVPVREGGQNQTTYQLVGATKWSNLVLKKGFTKASGDTGLLKWRQDWLNGTYARMDGSITQLNTALEPMATWKFYRGWPAKWEISEFDASKSELSIETLEIAHEGLIFG
jgi:phage tail-like protein